MVCTFLIWSSVEGHLMVVRELLKHQELDVNAKTNHDGSALALASKMVHEEVVRELLKYPTVDMNAKDDDLYTALMWASHKDHMQVVRAPEAGCECY